MFERSRRGWNVVLERIGHDPRVWGEVLVWLASGAASGAVFAGAWQWWTGV